MILTPSLLSEELLLVKMSEEHRDPDTETRSSIPGLQREMYGATSGEAFFASYIWFAKFNKWGRSINQVQISKLLEQSSSGPGNPTLSGSLVLSSSALALSSSASASTSSSASFSTSSSASFSTLAVSRIYNFN